jgi:hypothetical protein
MAIVLRVPTLILSIVFVLECHGQVLQGRPSTSTAPQTLPGIVATRSSPILAAGTTLQVQLSRSRPMKAGEPLEATLLHPLFVDGKIVVAKGSLVEGQVIALAPDRHTRTSARLHGDFTPFHQPQVRFNELVLPDGSNVPLDAPAVNNGAPVLELSSPGVQPHRSIVSKGWNEVKNRTLQQIGFFTEPGFGDRALQLLYHQLPYHPEQIPAHTAWTFELAQPLTLPGPSNGTLEAESGRKASPNAPAGPEVWFVNALLKNPASSATSKVGEPVRALVVEPVYDRTHTLVVPQGSTLVGRVSVAKPAQSLGRNGKLRFSFQQILFPEGSGQSVDSALAGATTDKRQDLSIDAEGTVTPKNKSSVIVPLALTLLAGRALDTDGNQTLQAGVASNGFGIIGRIVGTAVGSRELAAGIGYYAAALSIYENWLTPGRDVVFPLDTRIEIETSPLRATVLKPSDGSN